MGSHPEAAVQYTFTHKQYTEQQNKFGKNAGRAANCDLYRGISLRTEEKEWKNLSQGSRRVPVGTMKTEYTEQNIHNSKNT